MAAALWAPNSRCSDRRSRAPHTTAPTSPSQHGIITAKLPLGAEPTRDPPHRRMEEEHDFDETLHESNPEIPATDVRQLMQQHRLELVGPEPREGR